MTDRLAELTGASPDSFDTNGSAQYEDDVEDPEDDMDEESREALQKFQKEADAISTAIEKVMETVGDIESNYKDSLHSPSDDPEEKLSQERGIAKMLQENEKRSDAIRKRLKRIAGENKMFIGENPEKTGELRVRVNTHQAMTKRFMGAMQNFEDVQEKHQQAVRVILFDKLKAMNPGKSHEEISNAIEEGQEGWIVDNSPLMAELPPEEQQRLRNGITDLRSRNNDLKKLEESVIALHQMFTDMQLLVNQGGELLTSTEYNIENTKGATEAAHEELVQARNHQKSANKKKCCLVLLVIAIVLGVTIPLAIKYIPIWFPKSKVSDIISNNPITGNATAPKPAPTAPNSSRLLFGYKKIELHHF